MWPSKESLAKVLQFTECFSLSGLVRCLYTLRSFQKTRTGLWASHLCNMIFFYTMKHTHTHTPHACMHVRDCVQTPDAFPHNLPIRRGWDEQIPRLPRRLPLHCSLWRETHAHLSNWAPWFTAGQQLPSVQQNWHESVICPQLHLQQQQQQQ